MVPVFDPFPVAAASLDMTAYLAPLFSGLFGIVGLSTVGVVLSAILPRVHQKRRATVTVPQFSPLPQGINTQAASR